MSDALIDQRKFAAKEALKSMPTWDDMESDKHYQKLSASDRMITFHNWDNFYRSNSKTAGLWDEYYEAD